MTNEWLRKHIAADPDDSEPSAGSVEPPAQAATDDLVRRFDCFTREDGVYESATGAHVAYADYALLRATVERQAREIADLTRLQERNEGRIKSIVDDALLQRAERAEAERDAMRECLRAADVMRERNVTHDGMTRGCVPCSYVANYDAARAKVKP